MKLKFIRFTITLIPHAKSLTEFPLNQLLYQGQGTSTGSSWVDGCCRCSSVSLGGYPGEWFSSKPNIPFLYFIQLILIIWKSWPIISPILTNEWPSRRWPTARYLSYTVIWCFVSSPNLNVLFPLYSLPRHLSRSFTRLLLHLVPC
jgi:hypothetical protein